MFCYSGLGKKLFQNDLESVNNYEKEKVNSNIRYIPPVFVLDLNKNALPYKRTFNDIKTPSMTPSPCLLKSPTSRPRKKSWGINATSSYYQHTRKERTRSRWLENYWTSRESATGESDGRRNKNRCIIVCLRKRPNLAQLNTFDLASWELNQSLL